MSVRWLLYLVLLAAGLALYATLIDGSAPVGVKIAGGEAGSAALFAGSVYFLRRLPGRP
ncbi:hypothetical protein [Paenibacillus humicola]|uniref:hypothetical protein n=1 Tax=Paenibacillus humicola TaxID=3110540 RepID=UPI00237A5F72|nr:hypothetical protein [Paenibacillus humicola]